MYNFNVLQICKGANSKNWVESKCIKMHQNVFKILCILLFAAFATFSYTHQQCNNLPNITLPNHFSNSSLVPTLKKQSVDVMLGSEKIFVINEQSGKISRLFVQYLAFHNNGNFPKSLTYFPKLPNSK